SNDEFIFSQKAVCVRCGVSFPELTPQLFSFNSPEGACPDCAGFGRRFHLPKGSDEPEDCDFLDAPICISCNGARLRQESLHVLIAGKSIADLSAAPIGEALEFFTRLELGERDRSIADRLVREIAGRLRFLTRVGLDYLSLDRSSATLSGGEAQRVRLATEIGSRLVGVLYILDEPSVGLHPRDHARLLDLLRELKDLGNTVLVVEHDRETILAADHIVDLGPGAGVNGGEVVAQGSPRQIIETEGSLTGQYLSGRLKIPVPMRRRKGNGKALIVKGAKLHNLKGITAEFPLGAMTCVTGVSGSGKSSLVLDTLYAECRQRRSGAKPLVGFSGELIGNEHIDKVISVDQSPIGRTPRSNPATYTGLFPHIRDLFAQLPEARVRGFGPGRFSFNAKGGRCEACAGEGMIRIEMHFLPDAFVICEVCRGRRFNRETLEVFYKGRSIADVLDLTVNQALEFLGNFPAIRRKLETLRDVGMGYVHLGQAATTLSGGEAQRIKLARELSKRSTGETLYILDEPTTGLHFDDIRKLLEVLGRLTDAGNTVVVIEHNLEVIKAADFVIDLGPEGGKYGGEIVAFGTPEEIARVGKSHTGRYLNDILTH
ncbi:MAG: excinuclease ABC subunit UvrA, partial [Candidatus Binatia bacterium]